ncbi:MAG: DUF2191 domain-containing protein [Myxococcales bacterium]|nr:DUF2191 domain-containing protein [Myxococcales bacterium]
MRTTLTLDDDVAALLARLQEKHKRGLKELVNTALRVGLARMARPARPGAPFRTRAVTLGPCLLGDLDDISEALAVSEGDAFK